jgi:archaeal preflagellin peptidase FlaK
VAGVDQAVLAVQLTLLVAGFAYAAVADWREREVTDRLWQVLGTLGVVLGAVALSSDGWAGIVLWLLVGGFTLQHMFPWDDALAPNSEGTADLIEATAYVATILVVVLAAWRLGFGAGGVPVPVVALLLTVLFARGLFELGVLYGGADAKALMVAGLLVPVLAYSLLAQSPAVSALMALLPYPVDLLMDAALLSIVIPVGIAVRNLVRGEFRFPGGFSGYMIAVKDLPNRFVWLKDPLSAEGREQGVAETSEEDRAERVRAARELEAKGVTRVWVTPQIPFLVLMAAGALAALLAGNLVLDIIVRV